MTGTKGSDEGKGPGEGESDASVPRSEPSESILAQAQAAAGAVVQTLVAARQLRAASKAACDLLGEIAKRGLAQGGEQSPNRHECLDTAGNLAYWLAFTEDPMHARMVRVIEAATGFRPSEIEEVRAEQRRKMRAALALARTLS